jgi:hypothetical protein
MLKNLSVSPENAIISMIIKTAKDGAACLAAVRHTRRWRRPQTRPGSPPQGPSAGPSYRCLQHTVPLFSLLPPPPPGTPPELTRIVISFPFSLFSTIPTHIYESAGETERGGE